MVYHRLQSSFQLKYCSQLTILFYSLLCHQQKIPTDTSQEREEFPHLLEVSIDNLGDDYNKPQSLISDLVFVYQGRIQDFWKGGLDV